MVEETHWVLLNKHSQDKIEVVKSRMNVGRSAAADIICYSDKISRNHAYIAVDADGDLYVHDNESINGTFINCQIIDCNKLHKLKMRDEVSFGLHSEAVINEGRKYIFEVIDLRVKEEQKINKTPERTAIIDKSLQPVVMLKDIKLEPMDTAQINNAEPNSDKGYTVEDSVIVVDGSDESDDDFGPCSQLLNEKKHNLQIESRLGDSIFFEVKQELQEMEEGAEGCVVSIEDEYENMPISSLDLLTMLEGGAGSENNDKNVVPQQCPTKNTNHTSVIEKKTTKEVENSTATKKYAIPPIVPPHFEVPKSRKRKSTLEVSPTKNKRTKSTDTAKTSAKPKSSAEKTELLDKLKAVALKEKSTVVQEKQKFAPPPAKVKVSSSRGNFLMQPVESKPNLTRKSILDKPKIISTSRVSSKPTNLPSTSGASTSGLENKAGDIIISHGNFKLSRTHEVLEDILINVLSWHPKWFNERRHNNTLPPINKNPLMQLPNSFKSYSEYYSIVLPHWIVELWYFLCKEYDLCGDKYKLSFKTQLERCTNNGKFIELKCFVFISKEESDQGRHVKEEDIVILDVTFANSKKLRGMFLGSVSNVKKTFVRSSTKIHHDVTLLDGKVPHAVIDFNIIMKISRDIQSFKKTVEVNVITNMVTTWRIFKSIKRLKHSPLCDHILKPSVKNYQIQSNINLNSRNIDAKLNFSQRSAVMEASKLCLGNTPGICLIQGPPGTGKSTVIVNIVKQIMLTTKAQEGNRQCILLVAPTNTAIDDLVVKLIALKSTVEAENNQKLKIIRFGPHTSIGSAAKTYSLNVLARTNLAQTCLQKYNNNLELIELQKQIKTLKSQLGQNPQIEVRLTAKKDLFEKKCKELIGRSYLSELNAIEQRLLAGAEIICTTLSSCVGTQMLEVFSNSTKISCCIVDESTFSREQETFLPLNLGISKLVLIGDPKQLPGVTFAKEAKEFGHGNSLFGRLMENFVRVPKNPIRFLNVQYRMHPEICSFPNKTYYNGFLKNDKNLLKRKNPIGTFLRPYLVFQMENSLKNFNQQQEYQNDSETIFILKLVQAIVSILPQSHRINIGIITPYNVQKDNIQQIFKDNKLGSNVSIAINTVDSFQGQEKDIIILSSVRIFSNNFLADNQRLNVALTRAKYALYVVGTENLFKTCEIFGKLHQDSINRKLIRYIPLTVHAPYLTRLITLTHN